MPIINIPSNKVFFFSHIFSLLRDKFPYGIRPKYVYRAIFGMYMHNEISIYKYRKQDSGCTEIEEIFAIYDYSKEIFVIPNDYCKIVFLKDNILTCLDTITCNIRKEISKAFHTKAKVIRLTEGGHHFSEKKALPSNNEGHGLCSLVIRMRQEGKTNEEIAEFLDSSGRSLSQIGALLHTDPEATQATQMKLAQRLLGKA